MSRLPRGRFKGSSGIWIDLNDMLKEEVAEALQSKGAAMSAGLLWDEILQTYERGGPDAVETLLEKKVKAIRSSANAQGREMKEAAGAVAKKGRPKKRR